MSLPPNYCSFENYAAWFESEEVFLALKPGLVLKGPKIYSLGQPDAAPWQLDWAIIFSDGKHIRVTENYCQLSKTFKGAGKRQYLSYHYGDCSPDRDEEDFPKFIEQVDLRIDIDETSKKHIHYDAEDHIPEVRVNGLKFDKICPFTFIRAILEHRNTGRALHEIIGFTVEPQA